MIADFSFDLETYPLRKYIEALRHERYDPRTFKPRNGAKKPETIAEQQASAAEEFEQEKDKRVRDGALSPLTGRIVVATVYDGDYFTYEARDEQDEAALITAIDRELTNRYLATALTWNGKMFDWPFLSLRAAILGVPIRRRNWFGYNNQMHIDCMAALGRERSHTYISLSRTARQLGIDGDDVGDGADIFSLVQDGQWDTIVAKNRQDCFRTLEIGKILKEAFPV